MEIYKNYLEDFMYIHQKLKSIYIKELKSLPKGKLIGYLNNNNYQYYHSETVNGKYTRHGIGKNNHLKQQLARKEYLTKVIPILESNIKTLTKALTDYQSIIPDSIINKMSDVYKSLPKQYFIDKSIMPEELQQWMKAPFDQSTYKLHEKIHTTSRDLKVRTKSELIIAELLYSYNIAFRYEQRLYIRDKRFAPDFTIKLPNGKIFYWEHVGLTNSYGYMNDHYYKLKYYQYQNIVPWKNLILTYDNESGELNTQIIHSEIKNKLLI